MVRGIVLVAALLACGSENGVAPPSARGIRIVSGANVTDTVGTRLPAALIVEVRDSTGRLAPLATVVRFQVVPEAGQLFRTAFIASLSSDNFSDFASATTDASGRAGVLVTLGYRATIARIAISVPTLGVQDTARFTVTPGAAAGIEILPADTAIYSGRSYTLRGGITDAYGNVRNDPVTFTSASAGATVTAAGRVTATDVGRYTVVGSGGGRQDSAQFTVVPEATIAGVRGDSLVRMNLDGSGVRSLARVVNGGIGVHPSWIPGTDRIVYSTYNGTYQELRTVSEQGGASTRVLPAGTPFLTHEAEPSPSADGMWLFFTAIDQRCGVPDYCLQRLPLDGLPASPEGLGTFANPGRRSRFPGPSPNGNLVAFQDLEAGSLLRVLEIATKQVRSLNVNGIYPLWRPSGDLIAFRTIDGALATVKPDGTGARTLVPGPGFFVDEPFSWSPDGQWILHRPIVGSAQLVNVASGTILSLPYLGSLTAPRWK